MTSETTPSRMPTSRITEAKPSFGRGDSARRHDADEHQEREPAEELVEELADGVPQDPGSLGRRVLRPRTLISFALAAVILIFIFRGLDISPSEVWADMRSANPLLLLTAVVVYYLSFVLRAVRWTHMLSRADIDRAHGYAIPGLPGMVNIFLLSWFVNCVVPAKLGDAYRSYLLKERSGASFGKTLGTILAERLVDLIVLVFVLLAGGLVVFGTRVPSQAEQAFLLGAGAVVIGVVGVLVLWLARERLERLLPSRLTHHFQRLHTGIFVNLRRPLPFAATSVLLWLGDGLRLYFVAWSLDQHISFSASIVVALISALVTIVPITPAGLGLVEGLMIWILPQVGADETSAAAIALLDRSIAYGSLIVVGLPLYLFKLRRDVADAASPDSSNQPASSGARPAK